MFLGKNADNVLCCLAKVGGVGDFQEVKVLHEELDCVCVSSGRSGWDLAVVTLVVIGRRSNVPTVDSMC